MTSCRGKNPRGWPSGKAAGPGGGVPARGAGSLSRGGAAIGGEDESAAAALDEDERGEGAAPERAQLAARPVPVRGPIFQLGLVGVGRPHSGGVGAAPEPEWESHAHGRLDRRCWRGGPRCAPWETTRKPW